jgi:2-C-methyl-D-erythritol 4-phosphate cytidylyltransferase
MNMNKTSLILLAGGTGSRMKSSTPKQFLNLQGKQIWQFSFAIFQACKKVTEIVIVCDPCYRDLLQPHTATMPIKYALPGSRRQDSVYNGFQKINSEADIVCIHDAARPFVTATMVHQVIETAERMGAAAAAMPLKCTIKEANETELVVSTPDRSKLWEIQTPQAIRYELLEKGFLEANRLQKTVTDDVSLVELINEPVQLVPGCYKNIKITTPEDLLFAELIANQFTNEQSLV